MLWNSAQKDEIFEAALFGADGLSNFNPRCIEIRNSCW